MSDHTQAQGPALAMLEIGDIPPGLQALDALVKEAPVQVLAAGTIQRGRYLILFGGEVEPVRFALARALETLDDSLLDQVLLPHAEERIAPALLEATQRWPAPGDTLGALQTRSAPTMLSALDRALKGTEVELVQLRVADGLGGKSIAMLWGETHAVEAAVGLAHAAMAGGKAEGCSTRVIRNADPEVGLALTPSSGFFNRWRG